jgi:hypothetical protein
MAEDRIDSIKRVNHFQGQFLDEDDFNVAHDYHRTMRYWTNFAMLRPGVVTGLDFDVSHGEAFLTVGPGMALDRDENERVSREIVLSESRDLALAEYAGKSVWVMIAYGEQQKSEDHEDVAGFEGYSRTTEQAILKSAPVGDQPDILPGLRGRDIVLGRVSVSADGKTLSYSLAQREYGGLYYPAPVLLSLSPSSIKPGAAKRPVTITGNHFSNPAILDFIPGKGLDVYDVVVSSPERISFKISVDEDAEAGARYFRVTTMGGTAYNRDFEGVYEGLTILKGEPNPVGLAIESEVAAIEAGSSTQLRAIATLENGATEDYTATAQWQSSDAEVAEVAAGVVTGVSEGVVTISAKLGRFSARIDLVVGPPAIHEWPTDDDRVRRGGETLTVYGERFAAPLQVEFKAPSGVRIEKAFEVTATQAKVIVPGPAVPTRIEPAVVRSGRIRVKTQAGWSEESPQPFILRIRI